MRQICMQNRAEYLDMSRAYDASGLEEKTVSKGDARTRVTYGEIQLYKGGGASGTTQYTGVLESRAPDPSGGGNTVCLLHETRARS